jgi:peptidoglycan-N-acetylglucosamine deacetylase
LQPNRPFLRSIDGRSLWEMPVTVMPFSRTPIHFSYFTFLGTFSTLAAKAYFRKAIWLCRLTRTSASLLLHPPDFMGQEDDSDMAYFPAMKMPRAKKLALVRWALKLYASSFRVKTMLQHVHELNANAAPAINGSTHLTHTPKQTFTTEKSNASHLSDVAS